MQPAADKLREIFPEERLGMVQGTAFLTAMICSWVVNPSGDAPKLLIGGLLAVAIVALALETALYGFGDEDDERGARESRLMRLRPSLLSIAIAATLVWLCVSIADAVAPDYAMAAIAGAAGIAIFAFALLADRRPIR